MNQAKVSICTPAYKRVHYLRRLIESIIIQTFKDFEFIITDDSDDDSVLQLVNSYSDKITIKYYKNEKAYGTPANWNHGISKATGEWIKLMHDDDWFATKDSLKVFMEQADLSCKFIFSAYANCSEETNNTKDILYPSNAKDRIVKHPVTLLAQNLVGPPSVTMIHSSITETYDERMKWRVDLDFYIRLLLQEKKYSYINKVLVNVGVSDSQVTNSCLNIPSVELPEGYLLLQKYGTSPLKHILVYDAWWRILRNNHISNNKQLEQFGQIEWPAVIRSIVQHQSIIPNRLLKMGIVSKTFMSASYCLNLLFNKM